MSGGSKKKVQMHKNKTAFKIVFDTQALQMQKKVSLHNLCIRCTQQMNWKLQYNKYKKATQAGKCNICLQKTVCRSYMKHVNHVYNLRQSARNVQHQIINNHNK